MIKLENKPVLDATCATRSMWINKQNPLAVFVDRREAHDEVIWESKDGDKRRMLNISPDIIADFTDLPFEDNQFYLVVFDPPHLTRAGETSWLAAKYGRLDGDWKFTLRKGFAECMRVLKPNGVLIFKWNETDIPVREIIKVVGYEPLFGHISGKHMSTHWLCFIKLEEKIDDN